eukprot:gnl/MRDRNA2_/MRDRNA2_60942_c0_seq1.p1 gnl/MRDRNA2_/MRDRNA2_60942_c0~~gnl/MRDRNA2_/MRDRNA2_60942_c0_seq1.p1  ORF type:complete len:1875 (+),score=360.74 gnl/MRDRNA2_/MRDRNA2_60942_c0_seq1:45-5669(+)
MKSLQLRTGSGVTADQEGISIAGSTKSGWAGACAEGLRAEKGQAAQYAIHVHKGLCRLGWVAEGGDFNNLGTDAFGFGFGGTGKKSHNSMFQDFGEPFGKGDTVICKVDRTEGRLKVEYVKNGGHLGIAFDLDSAVVPDCLSSAVLLPAVCGKGSFAAMFCDPNGANGPVLTKCVNMLTEGGGASAYNGFSSVGDLHDELAAPKKKYCVAALQSQGKSKQLLQQDLDVKLRSFFGVAGSIAGRVQDDAVGQWAGTALARGANTRTPSGDFRGSRDVRRISRSIELPSGPALLITDSQPMDRAAADRIFSRSETLWESLARGHCEIQHSGKVVCEIAALRKFGNADEKFGPLAHNAGGAHRAATRALPAVLHKIEKDIGRWEVDLVFLTKENGEMCKASFFEIDGTPYLAIGSKNVVLVASAANADSCQLDLSVYEDARYEFAKEIAHVFCKHFFSELTATQRCAVVRFCCDEKATIVGESISPLHQHIQSYMMMDGQILPEIRFFAITAPRSFDVSGLTVLDPIAARNKFVEWGLKSVESCEVVPVSDTKAVQALEQKYLLLPNREGAVIYAVVRPCDEDGNHQNGTLPRTALIYKWKNAWYVTVRALREKFCARASEKRIRNRISLLHLHHPSEDRILEEYLGFYRWILCLLPLYRKDFSETLGGGWIGLKAAYDAFPGDSWTLLLPQQARDLLPSLWLDDFPKLYEALGQSLHPKDWVAAMTHQGGSDKIRSIVSKVNLNGHIEVEKVLQSILKAHPEQAAGATSAEFADPVEESIVLTVVLVRGLQGSGKSSLCRALSSLLGGEWINQDEIARSACKGRRVSAKEVFLNAIEASAARPEVRYIFVDKIHTLRQHRDDVRIAVEKGFKLRSSDAGRVAFALLNFVHPKDEEGEYAHASEVCAQRIAARGLCHLSLVPQAVDVDEVVLNTGLNAEVPQDEEKCSFDLCSDLDVCLDATSMLETALHQLTVGLVLGSDSQKFDTQDMQQAVQTARAHEEGLSAQWKTLYWCIKLQWEDLLFPKTETHGDPSEAARQQLKNCLAKHVHAMDGLESIQEPHVTLLWVGKNALDDELQNLETKLAEQEGSTIHFEVSSVCMDASLGLVTLRVELGDKNRALCANAHPHITVAKLPGIGAALSNDVLQRLADGDTTVEQKLLAEPLVTQGVIMRQLAPESLAFAANCGILPDVGNPICELGLATTATAVDIVVTHDASVRWRRVIRTLKGLFSTVSEPLRHCKGWPPVLNGKQWFTLHERPIQIDSLKVFRQLEKQGQFQTLHVGVAYIELPQLQDATPELNKMKDYLVEILSGHGEAALKNAHEAWLHIVSLESAASPQSASANGSTLDVHVPNFCVQSKSLGGSQKTTIFRQALAFAVQNLVGWNPEIKNPNLILTASVKENWVLLALQIPRISRIESKAGNQVSGTISDPIVEQRATPSCSGSSSQSLRFLLANFDLIPHGLVTDKASLHAVGESRLQELRVLVREKILHDESRKLLELDGGHLEGGGQLLRNSVAFSAVLLIPLHVFDIRGGREEPGLRQSHASALQAIASLVDAKLSGCNPQSPALTFLPQGVASGSKSEPVRELIEVDAGTGGSTMLMLQAVLPVMLAQSAVAGGLEVVATLKGGTNVAPFASKGQFRQTAPQVDYVQLILLPMLRKLFGVSVDMQVRHRGFANGGGEVIVRASCKQWPLSPLELTNVGKPVRVSGMAYSSEGIPKHVLGRMVENTSKKKAAGAIPYLRSKHLDVAIEIDQHEVASVGGANACGIILAVETDTGCCFGGDSMGRMGVPAEKVGEEASGAALAALKSGSCADEHLVDQLIIYMALAQGTSRLRIGSAGLTLHARTALWVAEQFGVTSQLVNGILEVNGIGGTI